MTYHIPPSEETGNKTMNICDENQRYHGDIATSKIYMGPLYQDNMKCETIM